MKPETPEILRRFTHDIGEQDIPTLKRVVADILWEVDHLEQSCVDLEEQLARLKTK